MLCLDCGPARAGSSPGTLDEPLTATPRALRPLDTGSVSAGWPSPQSFAPSLLRPLRVPSSPAHWGCCPKWVPHPHSLQEHRAPCPWPSALLCPHSQGPCWLRCQRLPACLTATPFPGSSPAGCGRAPDIPIPCAPTVLGGLGSLLHPSLTLPPLCLPGRAGPPALPTQCPRPSAAAPWGWAHPPLQSGPGPALCILQKPPTYPGAPASSCLKAPHRCDKLCKKVLIIIATFENYP